IALGFAQQSVGVPMQYSDLLFALLTLVAELKQLEDDHSQAYVFPQLSLPPLPTVNSTILRVTLAADIFGISGSAYSVSQIAASETDS
ncbi:hypothetical protein M405DRAFT_806021, partial [Rhizopogon salebrosus TDB-379]